MAQSILYYPTIDIQDGAWLRNALLYWDSISSIVPYENYEALSPELLYLKRCNVYRPIFPRELFRSEYADSFTNAVITRLQRLEHGRSIHPKFTSALPPETVHCEKIYALELYEQIHYRKMTPELYNYLQDHGFLVITDSKGWIKMDSQAASIYMRILAEYIVKCCAEDIVIGTDLAKNQRELYTRSRPRENTACIAISLNDCLPQPSMDVGLEELLDFKSRHRQELLEFRSKLRDFETSLSACENMEELKFQTEKFKESWQLSLKQSEKMFSKSRVPFMLGTLVTLLSAPSIAGSLENLVPAQNKPIVSAALLGGTAMIGIGQKFLNYRNKVSERRSSAGFSYLLKASKAGMIDSISLS